MSTTFFFALCYLPLLCESGKYCYNYNYNYGGYTSYRCKYYLAIVDRFGIAYGVVAGIGLLASLIVYNVCKSRQRRANINSTILIHDYPNVGYLQSGQHVVLAPQAGIRQTTVPQGNITNPVIPMTNQQHQTPRSGPALTSTMGAEGTTQMSAETPTDQNKIESPPPYSL